MARERGVGVLVRVPHSSGMLEGRYTKDTVFGENDHRRHRTKEWLEQGLRKLDTLTFLTELRKQFLQWRSLTPGKMLEYVQRSRRSAVTSADSLDLPC